MLRSLFNRKVFGSWNPGWKSLVAIGAMVSVVGAVVAERTLHYIERAQRGAAQSADPEMMAKKSKLKQLVTGKHEIGMAAPDFILPSLAGNDFVRLASFQKVKPVVLLFGSMTCTVLINHLEDLERIYQTYDDRAAFFFVNIREAGHQIPEYEFLLEGIWDDEIAPQKKRADRVLQALRMRNFTMPGLIDSDDASVELDYEAWPLRLTIIDTEGKVALDLGRGIQYPWDLKTVEDWLAKNAPAPAAAIQ